MGLRSGEYINLVGICIPTTETKNLIPFFNAIYVNRENTELFGVRGLQSFALFLYYLDLKETKVEICLLDFFWFKGNYNV